MLRIIVLFLLCSLIAASLPAYNMRHLSSKEGLSNSSIFSICQDRDGFMWLGAADGLNMYNGLSIQNYRSLENNYKNSLSGNLIDNIMEAEPGVLWVGTNFGLNRFDKNTGVIDYFARFEGRYLFTKDASNRVFVIAEDNQIKVYDKVRHTFVTIPYDGLSINEVMNFFIDKADVLWLFFYNGSVSNAQVTDNPFGAPSIRKLNNFSHASGVRYCFYQGDEIFFIDAERCLYAMNPVSMQKSYIKNLSAEIGKRGDISDIIGDNNDFFISFQTNGLIRLIYTPEKETKYKTEEMNIDCGVLSLCKDKYQGTVWIGTDGFGVYILFNDDVSIRSTPLCDFPYRISKPIRALHIDGQDNLWIGTRDDGILMVKNYQADKHFYEHEAELITTVNTPELINNSNYVFEPGANDILWIGGDGPGLNYYSIKEEKIKRLPSESKEKIRHIHSICAINDTLLWIATGGDGFLKVVLHKQPGEPKIKRIEPFRFTKKGGPNNYFFSICRENDSIIWLGNRKYGCLRLNAFTGEYFTHTFHSDESKTINDILYCFKDSKGKLWFGSNYGLIRLDYYTKDTTHIKNYNETHGLINNTIHSIQEDNSGHLWLATNRGITRFDPKQETFKNYNHKNGLEIVEFSDGACYADNSGQRLFFGGVNGFISIKNVDNNSNNSIRDSINPKIFFTSFKVFEKEHNIADLMKTNGKKQYIELRYNQNFFSVSFVALDYVDTQNIRYRYKLENFSDKWINNGHANYVTFTNISPGEYTLRVRSENSLSNTRGETGSLHIRILPPWYMTVWAYLIYMVSAAGVLFISIKYIVSRYKQKKNAIIEKMEQSQKEKIHESRLRFFTDIIHELSNPLTLIYGPCERIVAHKTTDNYVRKYASLIMRNAERLNSLVQELIEFRRVETGYMDCKIAPVDITEISNGIAESFSELSETQNITLRIDTGENIVWNTDKSCFTKILTNLLSNSFKYTPSGGVIELHIACEDNTLSINLSNTGKSISKEDLPFVFDRFAILENFDKQSQKRGIFRNELGLAICHSLVKLLNGDISVSSTPDLPTVFTVKLPRLETTDVEENTWRINSTTHIAPPQTTQSSDVSFISMENYTYNQLRPTIVIIDDDPEMLWFLSGIFKEKYNIIPINNPDLVFESLKNKQPNLIISDIMMPVPDRISLVRAIKENRQTSHIPIMLLSEKSVPEEQDESIDAGVEMYLTKPFNVEYVKSAAESIIIRCDNLMEYFKTTISAFELTNRRLIYEEDKDLIERVLRSIEKNISDSDFSKEMLATELRISPRHLFRRLKLITNMSPARLIAEYRITLSEKLLIATRLSIEDIMDATGFTNRSTFYRLFEKKYNTTPRNYRNEKEDANQ